MIAAISAIPLTCTFCVNVNYSCDIYPLTGFHIFILIKGFVHVAHVFSVSVEEIQLNVFPFDL